MRNISEIQDSHGSGHESYFLLGCDSL